MKERNKERKQEKEKKGKRKERTCNKHKIDCQAHLLLRNSKKK